MSDSAPPPGSSSTPSSDPSSSSDGSPPVTSPPSSDNGQGAPPPDESSSSSSPPSPPSDNPPSPPDSSSSPPPPSDSSQDGAPPPSNSNDPLPPPPGSDNQPPPNSDNPEAPPPPSGSSSSPPAPPRSPPSHGDHPPPPPDGGSSSSPPSNSPSPPDNSNSPPPASFPSPKNPSSPPKSSPEVPSPPSGTEPSPPDTPPGSDNPVPDPSSPPRVVPSPPSRHTPSPPSGSGTLTPVPPQSSHSSTHNGSGSSSSSKNSSSSSSGGGTAAGITIGVLVLAMAALCFVVVRKRRRRRADLLMNHYQPPSSFSVKSGGYYNSGPMRSGGSAHSYSYAAPHSGMSHGGYGSQRGGYGTPSGMGMESGALGSAKSWFSYEELMEITNGFSHENMIGEGGFGCVYKGYLSGGKEVAVKQLKIGSGQGEREFRAEVEIISRVHHRHLVSLVGYCIAEHHRLLVYEFVPNGTLEHHLHGKGSMEWSKRVKIAIGSAKGLAYLHEDCHPRIIHRDIKSANILLDNSFEAQVADFGLAKLSNDTHTHVSTRVMGTFGYMAPEYASSGKLTDRSDVFSFGVVLLELVTGRKPVDPSQPLGEESLVEWARPLLIHAIETGEVQELVDPRLENNFDRNEMIRMIETAAACVRHSAPKRPRMQQVVRALDSEGEMADLTNGVKYGQSTVFQSSQHPSTDIQKFRRMAFGSNEQFSSQEYEPSAYSGEYGPHSREHWPQSSGEYPSNSDSETRAIYRRPS